MPKPKISVIMSVYNNESTIRRAVRSVQNQTFTDWEMIICNDASTDKTQQILEQIQQEDHRVCIIRNEKNLRLAASLNRCLQLVSGEYVARMDADDISLPSRFTKQAAFLDAHPGISAVGSQIVAFDENDLLYPVAYPQNPGRADMIRNAPFAHPSVMVRKEVYQHLHGYTVCPRTARAEDLDLWFRFFEAGYKGCNLREPLLLYQHFSSDLKKRSIKAAWGLTQTFADGYRRLKVNPVMYALAFRPLIISLLPASLEKRLTYSPQQTVESLEWIAMIHCDDDKGEYRKGTDV